MDIINKALTSPVEQVGEPLRFTPKWFYIFESPTGLLYLGQTVRKRFGSYSGSGRYWTQHLRKHGKPSLIFLRWCNNVKEFQSILTAVESEYPDYFSSDNVEWANLIPETPYDNEQARQMGLKYSSGDLNPMKNPKVVEKMSGDLHPLRRVGNRHVMKEVSNRPEIRAKKRENSLGSKNPRYDSTIYPFVHRSGIQRLCTKHSLRSEFPEITSNNLSAMIKGRYKHVKGWSLNGNY